MKNVTTTIRCLNIRARACIRCKEYLVIHPNNPTNQKMIKEFGKKHLDHAVVTLDLDEVKGTYKNSSNTNAPSLSA